MMSMITSRHENALFELWREAAEAKYDGKGQPFTKADFDKFLGEFEVLLSRWEEGGGGATDC